MRSALRPTVWLALLLLGRGAWADANPAPVKPDPRIEQKVAQWRRSGASALPLILDAVCNDGDDRLRRAAESELRRRGLSAAEAALHRKSCRPTGLIAELLCQSPMEPSTLEGLLRRLAPLTATRNSDVGFNLWSPLAEIYARDQPGRIPPDCPNRQVLAVGLVAHVFKPAALPGIPREHHFELAGILPSLLSSTSPPTDPAPYVPELAKIIERGIADRQIASALAMARALGNMGTAAAPAVPALGHLIDKELAALAPRQPEGGLVAVPLESNLARIAEAVLAIGPSAQPLVDGLQKAYLKSVEHVCSRVEPFDADTLLRAIGVLDPTRWKVLAEPTERAWKALDGCASREPRWLVPTGTGGERLMPGVAAFGPRAASFGPRFRALMIDERRPLIEREQAARALQAIAARLDSQEGALARVLTTRLAREEREKTRPRVPRTQPTEMDAGRTALAALHTCREDAGLGRAVVADEHALMSFSYDEHQRFTACIVPRLCGPGRALDETLAACCAYAYTRSSPSFCPATR